MTKLVDRLKKVGRVTLASTAITIAASAMAGCGVRGIQTQQTVPANPNDDGSYFYVAEPGRSDHYLMCPTAHEPDYLPGDYPITAFINLMKHERWDYERSYYQYCIEEVRNGRPIPTRETAPTLTCDQINNLMDYQLDAVRERALISMAEAEKAIQATEKAQKELEKLALLKGGCCKETKPEVVVTQGDTTLTVNLDRYYEDGAPENIEDRLNKNFSVAVKNPGIDIDDQRKICNGDTSTVKEARLLSELAFEDCRYRPKDALNNGAEQYYSALEQALPQLQSGEYVLLSCGNATTKSARRCEHDPKDHGNADVSWKRAYYALSGAVNRFRQKLGGTGMAAFMNRTKLDERTAKTYLVKK
jgi:hypothetical protein